jgi:flagellar basal-body rod modification protein FlgD
MEISSVTSTNTTQNAAASKISSDFETFLKMLTAQISNQDPLNPIDASDYSTQLATFSGVEQQVQTNDLLKQIQAKLTQSDLVSMSHWVGKQVEIPDNVNFSGDAAEIRAFLPDGATHGNVEILSASGTVIKKITLDSGESKVSWDGTDQNGTAVTYGTYSARLVPYDGETEMDHQSVYAYHSVNEVSMQNGQAVLGLTDGNYIYTDMVTALRL